MYSCWSNLSTVAKLFVQQVEIPVCANSPWDTFTNINLLGDNNLQAHRTPCAAFFFFRKCHWTYLFQLEITCENSSLAAVHTVAAIEEFWHEGRIKGIEVDRGHVVNGEGDFLLKKVVTFVEKDLQQHIDEVEEHWGPEKLLKDPQTQKKRKSEWE